MEQADGIYYVKGEIFAVQILRTAQLLEIENLWLKCLTSKLSNPELINRLLNDYRGKEDVENYSAAMDVIVRANEHFFEGGKENMCKALDELLQPRVDEAVEQAVEQVREQITEQITERVTETLQEKIRKNLQQFHFSEEQIREIITVS